MTLADLGIRRLSLEISTTCNIRCTFCPIDLRRAPTQFLSLETLKGVLDQLAADGSLELVGLQFLNEPLLHPQIGAIVAYAQAIGLKTFVSTNGTVLTPAIIEMLARTSPTLLKVSVQDVNPKTFKVVKGTKMSYEEFMKRVAHLVRRRLTDPAFRTTIELDVAVPIRPENQFLRKRSWMDRVLGVSFTDRTIGDANQELARHIERFLKYLETEAQAPMDWGTYNPDLYNTKTWGDGFAPTARLGEGVTLELKAFTDWIGIDQKRPITFGACPRLNHLVINYKGDFQLCCIDTHGRTAIGNVFRQSIREILATPENLAKLLRAPGFQIPTEHCRSCLGAPTRRGVALLNWSNRWRHRQGPFVPEAQRDARAALQALRGAEPGPGRARVVAAIDEAVRPMAEVSS